MVKHVVASAADVLPGQIRIAEVKGRQIGLFNLDGAYFALLNRCPHAGAPLCAGQIIGLASSDEPGAYHLDKPGQMLRCPWHGWEFDIRTGQSWTDPAKTRAPSFAVTREAGADIVKGPYVAESFAVAVEDNYLVVDL
jgi:nitrite reductase/ring-hydroxylating ferredoxin subunit